MVFIARVLLAIVSLALGVTLGFADIAAPIGVRTTGRGQPIVFLGGIGTSADVWNATTARLSPTHLCVVVSIAGFAGASPLSPPDFEAVRSAIILRIAQEHWRKPVLVGHSFGGTLALSLAASRPDLFGKVIIVDAYPFPLGLVKADLAPEAARQQATAVKDGVLTLTDADFRRQQTAVLQTGISDPGRAATALDWMLSSDRQTIAQAQYEMLSTDLRPQLAQISAPVLAIAVWRGREAFGFTREKVLQQMTEQYRAVPHYDVVVSDTARHFVMLDEPEWLASQISGFIQR